MLLLHQRVEVIFALHVPHPPCPHISIQVAARQESIFFSPLRAHRLALKPTVPSGSYCSATMIRKSRVWEEDSV